MALGDITIYSEDNGFGYPGDMNYAVASSTTVPQISSGEPVTKTAGVNYPTALASGGPLIGGGPGTLTPLLGVAATTSTEPTSATGANFVGSVSVTPIDEPLTYLVSTLATSVYFGNPATSQAVYDGMVGSRVTFARTGGVGASQIGGVYTINSTDATANGLIVEELDIMKFPGKVRFSFRNQLSYRQ